MYILKQIFNKLRSYVLKLHLVGAVIILLSVGIVSIAILGVYRVVHNESFFPSMLSSTKRSNSSSDVSATLPSGSNDQALQADLTVILNEMNESGNNVNDAKSAVSNSQTSTGN